MNIVHVDRPWGNFERYTLNEKSSVKILTLKPNQRLSLQYHNHRDEFCHVITGSGVFVKGEEEIPVKVGDEVFIERLTHHRLIAGDEGVQYLEISFGEFVEADNIHIEDAYGRTVLDMSQDKEIIRGQEMKAEGE